MGEHFTAKNFRTWHASALALKTLAEADGVVTIKALMEEVADKLGNTPAMARKSYVHPGLLESYLVAGSFKIEQRRNSRSGLTLTEANVALLFKRLARSE